MLNMFYKNQGSITVFLTIVLVPTLLFMSLMVDCSNFILSKGMVESAGELATNGALAEYDTVLKDVYGIFAMSQLAEDPQAALVKNVQNYFNNSLKANGIMPEQTEWNSTLFNIIQDALNETAGIDPDALTPFVNVQMKDSSSISYMENSSLANPDVLKNQIVEASKYRVPINSALSALDTLSAFKKTQGQSEVIKKKTEVDEKQEDINKKLKELYNAIVAMDTQVGKLEDELKTAALSTGEVNFSNVSEKMKVCHAIITELEMETINYNSYNNYGYVFQNGDTITVKKYDGNEVSAWASDKTLDEIENEYYDSEKSGNNCTARKKAENTKNKLINTSTLLGYATYSGMDYAATNPFNTATTPNPTKLKEALEDCQDYANAIVKMGGCIKAIDVAKAPSYEYPSWTDSELGLTGTPTDEQRKTAIKEKQKEYDQEQAKKFEDDKKALKEKLELDLKNNYKAISLGYYNAWNRYKSNYTGYHDRLITLLEGIYSFIHPVYEAADDLKTSKITAVIKKADELIELIGEFDTVTEQYSNAISKYERDFVDCSSDEFSETSKATLEKIKKQIKQSDVEEIKKQAEAVNNYLDSESSPVGVLTALESFKLVDVSLVKNSNASSLAGTLIGRYKNDGTIKSAWDTAKIGSYFKFDSSTFEHASAGNKYADSVLVGIGTDSNNMFNKTNTSQSCYLKRIGERGVVVATSSSDGVLIDIPPLYFYMITLFAATKTDKGVDKNKVEKFNKDKVDVAEKKVQEGVLDYAQAQELFKNVPSGSSDGQLKNGQSGSGIFKVVQDAANTFSEIFGNIGNITGEDIIDDLLVTEYVLDNFSNYLDPSYNQDKQTYSNVAINKDNNPLYGCEVEYILYGKKTKSKKFLIFTYNKEGPSVNVNDAKSAIFSVRLMFDMVFALTDSTIDYETMAPALAIQSASGGLFPYQVAQTVIKLGLALAEANEDVKDIMDNKKVPLVKTKNTWKMQLSNLSGFVESALDDAVESVKEDIHDFSDCVGNGIQALVDTNVDNVEEKIMNIHKNVQQLAESNLSDIINAATQVYTSVVESEIQKLLTEGIDYRREDLVSACDQALIDFVNGTEMNDDVKAIIQGELKNALDTMLSSGGEIDNSMKEMMSLVDEDNLVLDTADKIKEHSTKIADSYNQILERIAVEGATAIKNVSNQITNLSNKISTELKNSVESVVSEAVNTLQGELDGVIDSASEKVSETINSKMKEYFPTTVSTTKAEMGNSGSSSAVSKIFSLGYEDYLRIFLLVKLLVLEPDDIMVRIADVMQINLANGKGVDIKHQKGSGFRMNNAYTYVEVDADIQVKPLLISSDIIENMYGKKIEYLSYEYHTLAGY